MSNNAHDLNKRLLNALDSNYNVVDMHAVNQIITILEKINITKELLETTRLGKHVNELRRKTADPTLARRAKVLVKRWRDLVIPAAASPAQTVLPVSNRSSAERTWKFGGTPLTSPALSRQVVSPAVPSPRPTSRPAWGGYESDSNDVILVDDDPPAPAFAPALAPALAAHKPLTPTKRTSSPAPLSDEKKSKRDKKPKKRRGHSRAGSGSETSSDSWVARNGSAAAATPTPIPTPTPTPTPTSTQAAVNPAPRKNGCRPTIDAYSALVNRIPAAGAKKVKTTKELLEEIQSRGGKPAPSPGSPASPGSPDVMVIEPEPSPIKVDSPLRNGSASPRPPSAPPPPPLPPLEDERPYHDCTCGDEPEPTCLAARDLRTVPAHVRALHHTFLPGINGTRAPPHPHQFAVRKPTDPDNHDLFTSVVPLYIYSDYADDFCIKNMDRVPLCSHLPWEQFAPPPPSPPRPATPPTPRPYPIEEVKEEVDDGEDEKSGDSVSVLHDIETEISGYKCPKIEAEMVGVPKLEPSERLKAPIIDEEETQLEQVKSEVKCDVMEVDCDFVSEPQEHRTVERTKEAYDGRTLYDLCDRVRTGIPYDYRQTSRAPVVTLPLEVEEIPAVLDEALVQAKESTELELGKPARPENFTEWHECAKLGDLIALPYVVID